MPPNAQPAEAGGENQLANEMRRIILDRIAANKLVIPAMPTVVASCMAQLRESDVNLKQLAETMQRDPILAVQVVRIANSAVYGGAGTVRSTQQAVSRLGVQKLRALLIELSARQLFTSPDRRIAAAFHKLLAHSVAVASLSRDLGALSASGDPDGAYLAGLLHDVGKPVIAAMLLEAERLLGKGRGGFFDADMWISAVAESHREVGVALATQWNLPEAVTHSIRDCGEYDMEERLSIANVVRFSNALAKKEGIYVGVVDMEGVEALLMIGRSLLNIDDAVTERLTRDLQRNVDAVIGSGGGGRS